MNSRNPQGRKEGGGGGGGGGGVLRVCLLALNCVVVGILEIP